RGNVVQPPSESAETARRAPGRAGNVGVRGGPGGGLRPRRGGPRAGGAGGAGRGWWRRFGGVGRRGQGGGRRGEGDVRRQAQGARRRGRARRRRDYGPSPPGGRR